MELRRLPTTIVTAHMTNTATTQVPVTLAHGMDPSGPPIKSVRVPTAISGSGNTLFIQVAHSGGRTNRNHYPGRQSLIKRERKGNDQCEPTKNRKERRKEGHRCGPH